MEPGPVLDASALLSSEYPVRWVLFSRPFSHEEADGGTGEAGDIPIVTLMVSKGGPGSEHHVHFSKLLTTVT